MSKSSIEWTQATWNPIVGCSIVSPGCTNCYAMKMAARLEGMNAEAYAAGRKPTAPHYDGTTHNVNGNNVWTGKLARAREETLLEPLRRRKPTVYFVNSMSDLFHEAVPDEWIDQIFAVMALSPQHTFQVLTKRAKRMREYVHPTPSVTAPSMQDRLWKLYHAMGGRHVPAWPLPNVWLGVSTERQKEADERIPELLATPAAVRFISAEPLLGPIDLKRYLIQQVLKDSLRRGPLDDQIRQNGRQHSDHIAAPRNIPRPNGLPALGGSSISPVDIPSEGALEPLHGFGGRAVDLEASTLRAARSLPPVDGSFSIEEARKVSDLGNIVRNDHGLISQDRTDSPSEPLPINLALHGTSGRPQGFANAGDRVAGRVGDANSSSPLFTVRDHEAHHTTLDWVIVGGESGPGSRPMHPDWARALRDQCLAAGVPFFFKQWGNWYPLVDRDKDDPDWRRDYSVINSRPDKFQILNHAGGIGFHGERVHLMQRHGKKQVGRELDGIIHDEMPATFTGRRALADQLEGTAP